MSAASPADEKEHTKEEVAEARAKLNKAAAASHRDAPHLEALDAGKKAQLASLTAKVAADKLPFSQPRVMQYLSMHYWDSDKAYAAMQETAKWREEMKVESIADEPDDKLVTMCLPGAITGVDKEGRPIFVEKTGKMQALEMLSFVSKEHFIRQHVRNMIRFEKMYKEQSEKRGKEVYTFNFVMDMAGMGFGHRHAMWFLALASNLDAKHFPEQVERVFVINSPWFTPGLWEMARSVLHESISSKVVVLGWDWKKEILQYIDEDQLPADFGGSSKVTLPEYTPEQIKAYVKEHVKTPKTDEEYIAAGAALEKTVTLMDGEEVSWYFLGKDGYDVDFSVVVKKATGEVEELVKPERIVVHRGAYTATGGSCVITFKWDNYFSYVYGKYVQIALEKTGAAK